MYSFFRRVPKNVQSNNDHKKSSPMESTPPCLTMVSGTHFRGWCQRIAILLLLMEVSFLIIAMSCNRKVNTVMYKKSSRSQTDVYKTEFYTLWIAMKCLMLQLNPLREPLTSSIDRVKTVEWLAGQTVAYVLDVWSFHTADGASVICQKAVLARNLI